MCRNPFFPFLCLFRLQQYTDTSCCCSLFTQADREASKTAPSRVQIPSWLQGKWSMKTKQEPAGVFLSKTNVFWGRPGPGNRETKCEKRWSDGHTNTFLVSVVAWCIFFAPLSELHPLKLPPVIQPHAGICLSLNTLLIPFSGPISNSRCLQNTRVVRRLSWPLWRKKECGGSQVQWWFLTTFLVYCTHFYGYLFM